MSLKLFLTLINASNTLSLTWLGFYLFDKKKQNDSM